NTSAHDMTCSGVPSYLASTTFTPGSAQEGGSMRVCIPEGNQGSSSWMDIAEDRRGGIHSQQQPDTADTGQPVLLSSLDANNLSYFKQFLDSLPPESREHAKALIDFLLRHEIPREEIKILYVPNGPIKAVMLLNYPPPGATKGMAGEMDTSNWCVGALNRIPREHLRAKLGEAVAESFDEAFKDGALIVDALPIIMPTYEPSSERDAKGKKVKGKRTVPNELAAKKLGGNERLKEMHELLFFVSMFTYGGVPTRITKRTIKSLISKRTDLHFHFAGEFPHPESFAATDELPKNQEHEANGGPINWKKVTTAFTSLDSAKKFDVTLQLLYKDFGLEVETLKTRLHTEVLEGSSLIVGDIKSSREASRSRRPRWGDGWVTSVEGDDGVIWFKCTEEG
ncbi:hypothetical protein TrRE_jg2167, partial [Triparma retinervis]